MTNHDQNAIDAIAGTILAEDGAGYEQPMQDAAKEYARVILESIRAGKVPGIETMHADQACAQRILNEQIAVLRAERDEAKRRAIEAWKDANAAIEAEVARQVAAIMGSTDNEIARQKASKEVFRNERDALQIECGNLRSQLAHARSRGDDKEIAEKERDAALARVKEAEGEIARITERPRYAETPTPGHIIRRCEKCSGLMEIPNQLCLVQLVGCRACLAETQRDEAVGLLRDSRVKLEPNRNDPEIGNAIFAEEIFCSRIDTFLVNHPPTAKQDSP